MRNLFVLAIFLIGNQIMLSQINVCNYFTDHMVMQRDKIIPVSGTAKSGTKINLEFNGEIYSAKTGKDGKWKVYLSKQQAGGPYSMRIYTKKDNVNINDILVGDVWLAGGQSNMEWFVEGSMNAEEEIENANFPNIRIMEVQHNMSVKPISKFENVVWNAVTPATIKQFSAVGYFFGRGMYDNLNIPIGIISDNWGGTVVETWMSRDAFAGLEEYSDILAQLPNKDLDKEKTSSDGEFNKWLSDLFSKDAGVKNEKYYWADSPDEYNNWNSIQMPNVWENSGIEELNEVDGVVWFQKTITLDNIDPEINYELILGPIDDTDKTWINGNLVGDTYNRYNKNRTYTVDPKYLKTGDNNLVIRVEDYIGAGGFTADDDLFYFKMGDNKMKLGGKWKYHIGMRAEGTMPKNGFGPNMYPTLLYNGMINPLINFPIKGVIWYQGESNQFNAFDYKDHFERMIKDWRNKWNDQDMIFAWVQLANFGKQKSSPGESQWAEVRESQFKSLELPNTTMISAIDIGTGDNIHPTNKQEVGNRLSNAVLNRFFGFENKPYFISKILNSDFDLKSAFIEFNNKESLIIKNKYGYINGFTIAGEDKKFEWAKAYLISPNKIKVWSDSVQNPKSVRYLWEDNPEDLNLFDSHGLPLLPFRTDDWKLSTQK